jgi:hypothetical protein
MPLPIPATSAKVHLRGGFQFQLLPRTRRGDSGIAPAVIFLRPLPAGRPAERRRRRSRILRGFCGISNPDDLVNSVKIPFFGIPAKARIRLFQDVPDPGFRRGDGLFDFLRDDQSCKEIRRWKRIPGKRKIPRFRSWKRN